MLVNVVLVLFNMIPAFPMDGGRVVRALLAMRLEYTRATQMRRAWARHRVLAGLCRVVQQSAARVHGTVCVDGRGARGEYGADEIVAQRHSGERAMMTDFRTVSPRDSLAYVTELILSGSQQDFPVVEGGRAVGVLTRGDLLIALQRHGPAALVGDVMRRDIQVADSFEMLETVSARLQECGCHTMPVVHNGQVVGW